MMDRDLKQAWIDALRSGEYQQGNGALVANNGDGSQDRFCCLGVLCDVMVKRGMPQVRRTSQGQFQFRFDDDRWSYSNLYIPASEIGVELGFPLAGADVHHPTPGSQQYLAKLNDDYSTFAQIADEIEELL